MQILALSQFFRSSEFLWYFDLTKYGETDKSQLLLRVVGGSRRITWFSSTLLLQLSLGSVPSIERERASVYRPDARLVFCFWEKKIVIFCSSIQADKVQGYPTETVDWRLLSTGLQGLKRGLNPKVTIKLALYLQVQYRLSIEKNEQIQKAWNFKVRIDKRLFYDPFLARHKMIMILEFLWARRIRQNWVQMSCEFALDR